MEDVKRVERCEIFVGRDQCGLVAGHPPPCALQPTVPLSPDLGRLLEQTISEYESAARGYRRARRWLLAAMVANVLVASLNLWALAQ